jgi:hypothetical protein
MDSDLDGAHGALANVGGLRHGQVLKIVQDQGCAVDFRQAVDHLPYATGHLAHHHAVVDRLAWICGFPDFVHVNDLRSSAGVTKIFGGDASCYREYPGLDGRSAFKRRKLSRHAQQRLLSQVRETDCRVDLRIADAGLAGFRDMILDARHAVAAHRRAQGHEFAFAGIQIGHESLL